MVALAPVVLEGRHVRLEPLSTAHCDALAVIGAGPRATFGLTIVPSDAAETERYVEAALRERDAGRALPFATVARATGRVVGSTRFGNVEFWAWPPGNPNQRGAQLPDAVEIGWTWLVPDAQRTAINTEAKLLMLGHAFEVWRVHRVRFMTDARNTRSRDAIVRLGARPDGVLRGHTVGADGTVRDSASYSILEPEWPAVKARLTARLEKSG
jgi:RimJ/RimL family protein N-acetyltransferase